LGLLAIIWSFGIKLRTMVYHLPSLEEARRAFEVVIKSEGQVDWPDDPKGS
jgi:hypothetical protein